MSKSSDPENFMGLLEETMSTVHFSRQTDTHTNGRTDATKYIISLASQSIKISENYWKRQYFFVRPDGILPAILII